MMHTKSLLIGSTLALVGCSHAGTQPTVPSPTAEEEILVATAEYYLGVLSSRFSDVPDLDVVFERVFLRNPSDPERPAPPPAVVEDVAARHGARLGALEDHLACSQTAPPGTCSLEGADVVVALGGPDIEGGSGLITIRQWSRSSVRMESPRAYRSSAVLRVEKVDGAWRVTGVESLSISE